jgi:AcrR family transcriptional regulator
MPPPKVHDARLRKTLVEQTSRLVAERGADQVSVRLVAKAANTSTSAVYALFGGRDGLLAAVIEEAGARFAAHLAAVQPTDDPLDDLLQLGVAYRSSALDDPHFYRVMFDSGPARLGDPDEEGTFTLLRTAAQRCIDAGLCAGTDAQQMASTLWAFVHGLVQLELAGYLGEDAAGDADQRRAAYQRALLDIWLGLARR